LLSARPIKPTPIETEAKVQTTRLAGELIAMTCRDFQEKWTELLDAETHVSIEARESPSRLAESDQALSDCERALIDHGAECPTCRELGRRYQILRGALRAWGPPPVPPVDLADRILLAATQVPPASPWRILGIGDRRRLRPLVVSLGSIAAAVAVALLLSRFVNHQPHASRPATEIHTSSEAAGPGRSSDSNSEIGTTETRGFNRALVEATEATWDLARSASEPATRISRQVLDATVPVEPSPADAAPGSDPAFGMGTAFEPALSAATLPFPVPNLVPLKPNPAAASALLQQVGDQLVAGVRPLSSSARRAFGFLLGPGLEQQEARDKPPVPKGA
jgi:hypothetical protein